MKKSLVFIAVGALLAGCGSLNLSQTFENRVACTPGKDTAFYVSKYGTVGVASEISTKDLGICK